MDLLNIMKNGKICEAKSIGRPGTTADISVNYRRNGMVAIIVRNGKEKVLGDKVVPIAISNRLYFAREQDVHRKGYSLSKHNSNSNSNPYICISTSSNPDVRNFVGNYENLKFDPECKLYFVEKPKVF